MKKKNFFFFSKKNYKKKTFSKKNFSKKNTFQKKKTFQKKNTFQKKTLFKKKHFSKKKKTSLMKDRGDPMLIKPVKFPKQIEKNHRHVVEGTVRPVFSEILEWLQEFKEILVDDEFLNREALTSVLLMKCL